MRVSGVLAIVLVLCGCGLPFYVTLNPPGTSSVLASTTNLVFTISSTTQNNEAEFQGFELFYKFYANQGDIETNLQNVLPSDLINTYNFRQVCDQLDTFSGTPTSSQNLHSTNPYPLINVSAGPPSDRGTVFDVTIIFPGLGLPLQDAVQVFYKGAQYFAPNDPTTPFSIRRNIGDTNISSSTYQRCKNFIASSPSDPLTYQSAGAADADVQPIVAASGGTAYLAMYAASFGRTLDYTTNLYSTPVYLGYVPVNINQ